MDTLEKYIKKFQNLRVNRAGDHESPHKACMLLSVIGLAEAGLLADNRISYSPALLDRYAEIFRLVRTETDKPNPYFPYFFLRSSGFWHHKAKPGREAVLTAMSNPRSHKEITDTIEYAFLDPELHTFLLDAAGRQALRENLIARWFGRFVEPLSRPQQEDLYERRLRETVERKVADVAPSTFERNTRDVAFRRVVTQVYDYRCAASGLRVVLPGDLVMVEAAHLIPFSESRDDDPRNGIALTPDFHWALDRNIIAPGPDLRWHVSKVVDDRFADNKHICDLEGRPIILPGDKRFRPRDDALAYRLSQLARD